LTLFTPKAQDWQGTAGTATSTRSGAYKKHRDVGCMEHALGNTAHHELTYEFAQFITLARKHD